MLIHITTTMVTTLIIMEITIMGMIIINITQMGMVIIHITIMATIPTIEDELKNLKL